VHFTVLKDVVLPRATLQIDASPAPSTPSSPLELRVHADNTALFVFVEAMGRPGIFSDNAFHLRKDEVKSITFTPRNGPMSGGREGFLASLRVRSLWDTVSEGGTEVGAEEGGVAETKHKTVADAEVGEANRAMARREESGGNRMQVMRSWAGVEEGLGAEGREGGREGGVRKLRGGAEDSKEF
jgi:hypothetical protein